MMTPEEIENAERAAEEWRRGYIHGYLHGWSDRMGGRQYGAGRNLKRPTLDD